MKPQSSARAFSLVEVVIALGLVGFALIAVLAFFPVGLSSSRSSAGETRAAQLARAIFGTIDSQCATFSSISCYGLSTLDLTSLNTMSETTSSHTLYASYPSPNDPVISSTQSADAIYTIELRFDNNPPAALGNASVGTGRVNLIEIRVFGTARNEGSLQFIYLVRNKG